MEKLKVGSTVWCPFDTEDSNYVKVLKENGFNVIHTHIFDGQDFFEQEVPDCDYIISNLPYSLKGEVFSMLYEIDKPFAMLINFQGIFDHKDRFELFKNHRVEMMWLSPRVNYIKFILYLCYLFSPPPIYSPNEIRNLSNLKNRLTFISKTI